MAHVDKRLGQMFVAIQEASRDDRGPSGRLASDRIAPRREDANVAVPSQ